MVCLGFWKRQKRLMTSRKKRKQPQTWQRSCCAGAGLLCLACQPGKSNQLEMCHAIHDSCSILLHQYLLYNIYSPMGLITWCAAAHISIPSHCSEVTPSATSILPGVTKWVPSKDPKSSWPDVLTGALRWNNGLEELQGHNFLLTAAVEWNYLTWSGAFPVCTIFSRSGSFPLILPPGSTLLDKHLPWLCLVWNCTDCASHAAKCLIVQHRYLEPVRSCHPERYVAIQIANIIRFQEMHI